MMRFPSRLTWDLTKVRIAQKLSGAAPYPLALRLDLGHFLSDTETTSTDGANSFSKGSARDSQALSQVRASSAPVVWIGDAPLQHSSIGHLTREIVNFSRTVFVEMDATLLRRRIHEFRPVSRLYLVLPLNGLENAHDSRAQHHGNFRATLAAIRTARLSGFHICIETAISPDFDLNELLDLANLISTLDVDGWIHNRPPGNDDEISSQLLRSARALIPSRRWRAFSELLDGTSGAAEPNFEKKRPAQPPLEKIEKVSTREVREEGVRAL